MLLPGQTAGQFLAPPMQDMARPVYVRAFDIPAQSEVAPHTHPWAQFTYATAGVLHVRTEHADYLVPPHHAVWIPAGVSHGVYTHGKVTFHSLYIAHAAEVALPTHCQVVAVTPLASALIRATADVAVEYDLDSRDGRLMQVVVDQITTLPTAAMSLPMPTDPRLLRIARALQAAPGDARTLDEWGHLVGATRRTLARLFRQQCDMTFSHWRQALRLLTALPRLEAGESVTTVAGDFGYESTSAFIVAFRQRYGKTPGALFATGVVTP